MVYISLRRRYFDKVWSRLKTEGPVQTRGLAHSILHSDATSFATRKRQSTALNQLQSAFKAKVSMIFSKPLHFIFMLHPFSNSILYFSLTTQCDCKTTRKNRLVREVSSYWTSNSTYCTKQEQHATYRLSVFRSYKENRAIKIAKKISSDAETVGKGGIFEVQLTGNISPQYEFWLVNYSASCCPVVWNYIVADLYA